MTLASAAPHLVSTSDVPTARPDDRVDAVRGKLAEQAFTRIEWTWVVEEGRLVGVVATSELLTAPGDRRIETLARPAPPTVARDTSEERIALHAVRHGLEAVPVTEEGRFVGIVPAGPLIEVLYRESLQDVHRLVGISSRRPSDPADRLGESAPRGALQRLPWLVIGLAGSLGASGILTSFEETLERTFAAAFFIPAIVYVADAVGTQTEAIVVRGLAVEHRPLARVLPGELATGAVLGLVLSCLAFPAVALLWGNVTLGLAVGISVFVACSLATFIGLLLPWMLSSRGIDPALGSGPLATIVQDVLSIVVYLGVVRALLG